MDRRSGYFSLSLRGSLSCSRASSRNGAFAHRGLTGNGHFQVAHPRTARECRTEATQICQSARTQEPYPFAFKRLRDCLDFSLDMAQGEEPCHSGFRPSSIVRHLNVKDVSRPSGTGAFPLDTTVVLLRLQHLDKSFLRNVDAADAFHPLFSFFLLLQQLAFSRDIAAVTFRGHVLA